MQPRIPQGKRLQITGMSMSGLGHKKIAQATGVAEASVEIIRAYRDEGQIADAPRCLTKKITEKRRTYRLFQIFCVSDNPFITAGEIRAVLGLNVSNELTRQRLREADSLTMPEQKHSPSLKSISNGQLMTGITSR
ncbi:hypothetical protein HPB48_000214 [Haemaphysalis longicornis]|uniref:Uncharacterized protein n=1 Tax=Haemaphysalis longicornis TaxID=44386 RepID=A0A9J6GT40_HAELO|nr:hypothetical protein HPB48_000214 [Haemaphysalis longicornis]